MAAGIILDTAKLDVAGAFDTIAPAIPPDFVEALAARLAPYSADLGTASADLAADLTRETARLVPADRRHVAAGLATVAVELAARRVASP